MAQSSVYYLRSDYPKLVVQGFRQSSKELHQRQWDILSKAELRLPLPPSILYHGLVLLYHRTSHAVAL